MKVTLSKRKNNPAKIDDLPNKKLDELLKVINTRDNMSIIGNWTEIDDELILDYSDQLFKRLDKNSRRSDE